MEPAFFTFTAATRHQSSSPETTLGITEAHVIQAGCPSCQPTNNSPVFQYLPEPNRACLVGVYAVTLDPLLSVYGIIYVTWYTRHLPKATSQIPVAFGIPGHVTNKHLPDTPC